MNYSRLDSRLGVMPPIATSKNTASGVRIILFDSFSNLNENIEGSLTKIRKELSINWRVAGHPSLDFARQSL